MRQSWWKVLSVLLLGYTITYGLIMDVPARFILNETIRNLYFHVPMWFAMMVLFAISFVYAIVYLRKGNLKHDLYSARFIDIGILFSVLGMVTGMEWANYTWGEPWSNDPKQMATAMSMLIYFAYLILRSGIKDEEKKARISAVYNIFAFAMMPTLLLVIPRLVDSLHPGNGGNPAFKQYDLDDRMRLVFYPACIGWILLSLWITTLAIRADLVRFNKDNDLSFDFEKQNRNA